MYADAIAAIQAVPGTLAASAHQSHAYPDGACLYFTFAGKPDGAAKDAYYRAVWDAGTRAVLAHGGSLSHHHGVGINRGRFMREALGAAHGTLGGGQGGPRSQGHPQPGQARLRQPVRPQPLRRPGLDAVTGPDDGDPGTDGADATGGRRDPGELDLRSIGLGALVALAIVVPCGFVIRGAGTGSAGLLFLGVVIGFGLGGAVAGRTSRTRYLTQGAASGLVAVSAYIAIGLLDHVASGRSIRVVALVFTALLGTCCGMLGASIGDRRQRRPDAASHPEGDDVSILVIDVGTSSVRASVVRPDATIAVEHQREALPDSPAAGLVEFDAAALGDAALELAARALADAGPVDGVGIANQRASTIVWDRATGEPVGPALGWQDLRTIGECLTYQAEGVRLAPNQSATKLAWLLDTYDPDRSRDLCFGTPDTWIAWRLSQGAVHVTDLSNAAVTGLVDLAGTRWNLALVESCASPRRCCRRSSTRPGCSARPVALDGRPPIAGMLGDQQASMLGQGVVAPGPGQDHLRHGRHARRGRRARPAALRHAWRRRHLPDRGLATRRRRPPGGSRRSCCRPAPTSSGCATTSASSPRAPSPTTSPRPATRPTASSTCPRCSGSGTPQWDYGARGTLLGLTRGAGRPQIVRAVLEGVAQRGADLVDAAETDGAPGDRGAAGRRRHEPQPDLRAGAGRRHPAPGRDLAGGRGHHPRGRLRCRAGPRHLGRTRRDRRHLGAHARPSSPAPRSTASGGPRPSGEPDPGSPSSPGLDF